jgi:NAD(P)-dependent dehydrogenase (short-subunit alcohol dehydrogenase family)
MGAERNTNDVKKLTMKAFGNKTVVITGGTSGIGKATALAFSRQGASVVVSGRRISGSEIKDFLPPQFFQR